MNQHALNDSDSSLAFPSPAIAPRPTRLASTFAAVLCGLLACIVVLGQAGCQAETDPVGLWHMDLNGMREAMVQEALESGRAKPQDIEQVRADVQLWYADCTFTVEIKAGGAVAVAKVCGDGPPEEATGTWTMSGDQLTISGLAPVLAAGLEGRFSGDTIRLNVTGQPGTARGPNPVFMLTRSGSAQRDADAQHSQAAPLEEGHSSGPELGSSEWVLGIWDAVSQDGTSWQVKIRANGQVFPHIMVRTDTSRRFGHAGKRSFWRWSLQGNMLTTTLLAANGKPSDTQFTYALTDIARDSCTATTRPSGVSIQMTRVTASQ